MFIRMHHRSLLAFCLVLAVLALSVLGGARPALADEAPAQENPAVTETPATPEASSTPDKTDAPSEEAPVKVETPAPKSTEEAPAPKAKEKAEAPALKSDPTPSAAKSKDVARTVSKGNGIVSLAYTNGKWTLTLEEAKAWEVKMITPSQEIVCGQNYGNPCTSTVYTFKSQENCVMVQVDWQSGSGYNSSDPKACKPTTPPEDDTDTKKVEFCHATGSESNPYVLLDTSVNAFYQAGHDTHQGGRDIVPPFSYKKQGQTISFPGLNWDATGQAIFKNGCEVPKPDPKCVEAIDIKDIEAKYTTDDFNASVKYTGKELCVGVSKTVSLNSYETEGPTWEASGNQSFFDHDQFTVTIDKDHTAGTLTVKAPKCFYQTDLYWGSTRYDGTDGALPHYPDSWVPAGLIDHRNGGKKCDTPVTPPKPEPIVEKKHEEGTPNCDLKTVTITFYERTTDWTFDKSKNEWIKGEPSEWKVVKTETRDATEQECPTPPTKIDLPTPAFEDLCGPNNAKWKDQIDTDVLTWKVDEQGNLIVTIIKDKVVFVDNTATHNFGKAPESGELCPPSTPPTPPVPPVVTPECPDGVTWSDKDKDGVVDKGECQSIGTPISIDLPPNKPTTPVVQTPSAPPHAGVGGSTTSGDLSPMMSVGALLMLLMVAARARRRRLEGAHRR
jgi:hypothetical protein